MSGHRRVNLTFVQKLQIIYDMENNRDAKEICTEYGCHQSTLRKILKNKDKLIKMYNDSNATDESKMFRKRCKLEKTQTSKTMNGRRQVKLTIVQKLQIIHDMENNRDAKEICAEYGCHQSTLGRTLRNKDKIIKMYNDCNETDKNKIIDKHCELGAIVEVERELLIWYNKMKAAGRLVCPSNLKRKAVEIGNEIGHDVNPNGRWMYRWQKREGVQLQNNPADKEHGHFQEMECELVIWCKQMIAMRKRLCGAMVKRKAVQIARELGQNFEPNAQWLNSFRKREGIQLQRTLISDKPEYAIIEELLMKDALAREKTKPTDEEDCMEDEIPHIPSERRRDKSEYAIKEEILMKDSLASQKIMYADDENCMEDEIPDIPSDMEEFIPNDQPTTLTLEALQS